MLFSRLDPSEAGLDHPAFLEFFRHMETDTLSEVGTSHDGDSQVGSPDRLHPLSPLPKDEQSVHHLVSTPSVDDDTAAIFDSIDASGNGVVSFDEFAEWSREMHPGPETEQSLSRARMLFWRITEKNAMDGMDGMDLDMFSEFFRQASAQASGVFTALVEPPVWSLAKLGCCVAW